MARYEDYKRDYERFLAESRGKTQRPRRSICLLLATLLGLAYGGYLIYYFLGGLAGVESDSEMLGAAFATYLVGPHMVLTCAAALCGLAGWLARNRWLALVAGILYLVAGLAFPAYFLFVVLQGVLSFVAFALMCRAPQASASGSGAKKSRAPVAIVAAVVCVALLGGAGWYYVSQYGLPWEAGGDEVPTEPIVLTPGEYTVGTHIPAGRYLITTDEDWCSIRTDDFDWILEAGDGGYTCTLEDGDELVCTDEITLTAVAAEAG